MVFQTRTKWQTHIIRHTECAVMRMHLIERYSSNETNFKFFVPTKSSGCYHRRIAIAVEGSSTAMVHLGPVSVN